MKTPHLILSIAVGILLLRSGIALAVPTLTTTSLTLTVNRTGDSPDLNPGDGLCDASVNAGEQCSLRAAIEELNAQGPAVSPHRIEFNLSGTGPFTISPGSRLPVIDVPVEIDGTTQPGTTCPTSTAPANLMIVLDGSNASGADGLYFQFGTDDSTLQGLSIRNFQGSGLWILGQNLVISCNQLFNNNYGIHVFLNNNIIGGQLSPSQRNVISNSYFYGILIYGNDNQISNNFVGTTPDGTGAASNNTAGIYLSGNSNLIGGATAYAGNLISGNGAGIWVSGGDDNVIVGNDIGVAIDEVTSLPNSSFGIRLSGSASNNRVGGTAPGEANRIAYNQHDGIGLSEDLGLIPSQNEIRGNHIYANGDLGIDLGSDGVTANDNGDGDGDVNMQQNYPILSSTQGSSVVTAILESQPNRIYTVDLFRNNRCDPSGYGEGQEYLQTIQMATDGAGQSSFSLDLAGLINPGDGITATATDPDGNTSEFSNCAEVNPAPRLTLTVNWDGDLGDFKPGDSLCETASGNQQCSLRAAIDELNAQGPSVSKHLIEFAIPGSGPFTIMPETGLPEINVPLEISGETQTNASCPTPSVPAKLMIVLDGKAAGPNASGLVLGAGSDGSLVSGLAISSFDKSGIQIDSDENTVRCSQIGIAIDGKTKIGNGLNGITINGTYNVIGGGNIVSRRNVISGNLANGVSITASGHGNTILNNFIGTTADGMSAAGNHTGGVAIAGSNNYVFSTSFAAGMNLISGNDGFGIQIIEGDDNMILRNVIGLAADSISSLPNTGNGIEILGEASQNVIGYPLVLRHSEGSSNPSNANLIANNGGNGIMLKGVDGAIPMYNQFYQNVIYDNAGLGIDLGDDGVNLNDPDDSDLGENGLLNYPVLSTLDGSPIVTATLQGQPNTHFIVDFFRNRTCDPSGYGEGEQYLNSWEVDTDGSGQASIRANLSGALSAGEYLSATATDWSPNTSEFSNCVAFTPGEQMYPIYLPLIRH